MRILAARRPALASRAALAAMLSCCAGVSLASCTAATASAPSAVTARPPASPRPAPPPPPAVVVIRHLRLADGDRITVARFTGGVRFVLHCGTQDPGRAACRGLAAGPKITRSERPGLVAAFNGGFKLSAADGGYEQAGRIISPLRPGLASLVIYQSGSAAVGAWQHGVPASGQQVVSVRQNLKLLVDHGRVVSTARDWWLWGATLTGGEFVARSAVGESAHGQLIYVGSMYASPGDLGRALVRAGAVTGMELDINPEWVQLDYAHTPGGRLRHAVTGQYRPGNQYLRGWTRDFVAVLAVSR
jgi:hypothetical protein